MTTPVDPPISSTREPAIQGSGNARRIIVVGAGIAGLAAAHRLQQRGMDVTVLEADDRVAGRMDTIEDRGFRLDTGAIVLSRQYAQMLTLAAEVGLASRIVPVTDALATVRDGKWHHVYAGSGRKNITTKLVSTRAKLSALPLAFDATRKFRQLDWDDLSSAACFDVESVRDYVSRHASQELTRHLLDPMYRGLYLEEADGMSAVDFLYLFGSFFGKKFFTFRDGVGALPKALAGNLNVRLGARVAAVEDDGYRVTVCTSDGPSELCDACVIALHAPAMASVYEQLDGEAREAAEHVEYSRILSVQLALQRRPDESALAMVFARQDNPELCSIFLDHNKSPTQAPAGKGLITVYWDSAVVPTLWDLDDDAITDRTTSAVSRVIPGIDADVLFSRVTRRDPGIVIGRPGIYSELARLVTTRNRASRVYLAGDYLGGSASNSSLCAGQYAADQICAAFAQPSRFG